MIDAARERLMPLVPHWGSSLRGAWLDLNTCHLMGPLTAYEVVSDLRWTPVLGGATDINTWASVGAGCANGLDWVLTGTVGTRDSSPGEVPEYVRADARAVGDEPRSGNLAIHRCAVGDARGGALGLRGREDRQGA